MAIPDELKAELENRLTTLQSFKPEKDTLIREQKEFSFSPVKENVSWFLDRVDSLQANINFIAAEWPDQLVREYTQFLDQLITLFNKIKEYDPTKIDTPGPEKDRIIAQVEELYTNNYRKLQQDLLPAEKNVSASEDTIKKVLKEVTAKEQQVTTILEKSQDALKAIQSVAASSPVERYQAIFSEESDKHSKSAKWWMWALMAVILIALAGAFVLFKDFRDEIKNINDSSGAIQLVVAKLVFVSIFFYIFHWISRNYSAQKHLEAINRQRQNSLRVFKSFVEATDDEKIKNMILIQASRAIFDHTETGFISSTSDSSNSEIQFIEQFLPKKD